MATIITAFDLTPHDCKVVQLAGQKTLAVRRALLIPFPPTDGEEGEKAVALKAQAVREALRLNKIQPINPVLIVPKHSATVRSVFLPSVEPAEVAEMARFEAEKIIPFNVERHVISHAVLTQESIGGSRVLLAAVDEPIISESLHVLTQAGIEPGVSQVSSLALTDAWRRENPQPPEGVTALVNIGAAHTDITLLSKGILLTTRSVLMGVEGLLSKLTEASKSLRPLEALDLADLDVREPGLYRPSAMPPLSASIAGGSVHARAAGAEAAQPGAPAGGEGMQESSALAGTKSATLGGGSLNPGLPSEPPTPRVSYRSDTAPFEVVPPAGEPDGTTGPAADVVRDWVGRLLMEIRRTFDFARREFEIESLAHVRLSGEGALIRGLEQNLTVTLGAEVALFSPLAEIPIAPKQPEIDERLLPAFSIAAGGALHGLWPEAYPINLLPSEMVERQEKQAQRLALMLLGAMLLVAGTVTYLYFSTLFNYRDDKLRLYEKYNAKMATEVKDLKDKKRKIGILEEYQRDRASSLAILDAISAYPKVGPSNKNGRITLTGFNYTSGDEVKIEGDAMDIPDINDFVAYLEKFEVDGKKVFRRVQIRQHAPSTGLPGRPTVFGYQLVCFLRDEGGAGK